jgi:hypothetical protein
MGCEFTVDDLESQVENTIDQVIRSFSPANPQSYDHWDHELERLGQALADSTDLPSKELLLGSVLAERIRLAFETGKLDRVVALTALFLRNTRTEHPSWDYVLGRRAHALHLLGNHDQELSEVLKAVQRADSRGSEFLYLLAGLGARHPGIIVADAEMVSKTTEAVALLRSMGYERLTPPSGDPAQFENELHAIVTELKRVNRAKGEALLSGKSP